MTSNFNSLGIFCLNTKKLDIGSLILIPRNFFAILLPILLNNFLFNDQSLIPPLETYLDTTTISEWDFFNASIIFGMICGG
jgi:hypothetical protein